MGCDCRLCEGNGDPEQVRRSMANMENRHTAGCECADCDLEAARITLDDLRRELGCQLAGFSETTRYWARLYRQINEGYLNPVEHGDVRHLQVAQIGDAVLAQAKSDKMPDTD